MIYNLQCYILAQIRPIYQRSALTHPSYRRRHHVPPLPLTQAPAGAPPPVVARRLVRVRVPIAACQSVASRGGRAGGGGGASLSSLVITQSHETPIDSDRMYVQRKSGERK